MVPIVDGETTENEIDFGDLKHLLSEVAHLSHKQWPVTDANSDKLCKTLCIESSSVAASSSKRKREDEYPLAPNARQLLERVIKEGNWDGAVESNSSSPDEKSWAVLVTGVNGIRKTTSMYQPWFGELLSEALVCPPSDETLKVEIPSSTLPTGSNSFFRQLDHMICTLCNEEFTRLYAWSTSQLPKTEGDEKPIPSNEVIDQYSNYKVSFYIRSSIFVYHDVQEPISCFSFPCMPHDSLCEKRPQFSVDTGLSRNCWELSC